MKTIIWDLDGTLLKSKQNNVRILGEVFIRQGMRAPSDEEFNHHYHGTLDETLHGLAAAQEETLSERQFQVMEAEFLEANMKHYEDPVTLLFPDALSLVDQAHEKGYRQIIITSRKHERRGAASPREIVNNSALKSSIDEVICGDDGGFRKPDVRVLDSLKKPLDKSNDIIVIGDQYVDAELGKNLNSRAILVNRETNTIAHLDEKLPNWKDFCTVVRILYEVKL